VFCARGASAAIDVNSAASAAARAASMAPSPAAARRAATDAAASALAGQSVTCASLSVPVDASQFHRGGTVQVSVHCTVTLSDLGLLGVPGTRDVSATARSPIDTFHRISLGFTNTEASSAGNRSGGGSV